MKYVGILGFMISAYDKDDFDTDKMQYSFRCNVSISFLSYIWLNQACAGLLRIMIEDKK